MKKFKLLLVTLLTFCVAICCFAACGNKYVGTYKFQSMKIDMGGMKIEINANEPIQGITFNEDFCYITLNEDGTAQMVMTESTAMDIPGSNVSGTWEVDDEANTVELTFEGEDIDVTIVDGILTLSEEEGEMAMTLVLAKAD